MENLTHPVLVFAVAFVSLSLASMASARRIPMHTDGAGASDYASSGILFGRAFDALFAPKELRSI